MIFWTILAKNDNDQILANKHAKKLRAIADEYENEKMKDLKHLFEDYKPLKISSLVFYEIFFIRRYLIIYSLIVQPNKVRIICMIHIFSTLFMVGYIWKFVPYSTRFRNIQECGNEMTILISIYLMTGYTDFFNSDQGRFDEGRECYFEDDDGIIIYRNEQCPYDYVESTM